MGPLRTGFLTLTLLTLVGCASRPDAGVAERDAFRTVARHLDRDGSEFAIYAGSGLKTALERPLAAWEKQLWANKDVHADDKADLQSLSARARLIVKLTGLDRLLGAGYSSRTLSATPPGRSFVHTELFLAIPPETPCLLNRFFAPDNSLDLRRELAELPRIASMAIIADLRPTALTEALKQAGSWGENLILTLDELWPSLEGSAGVWKLVTIPLPGGQEPEYLLQFPDSCNVFGKLPKEERDGVAGENGVVAVEHGQVTIWSSRRVREFLATPDLPKLSSDPEFEKWFEAMPEKGVFVLYQNSATSLADEVFDIRFSADSPRPALIAAARTDDGLRFAGNSACGLIELLFRWKLADTLAEAVLSEVEKGETPEKTAVCDCEKALQQLRAQPRKSATPGMAGLAECFDGKLPPEWTKNASAPIYFGESARPDLPLAISAPARHDDRFHVLFNDGAIRTYELEKPGSCRRIVSFLQTERHWDENVWTELMRLAEKLDAESKK